MTETMRAFVMKKVGETGVVDKPIPEPGPEDAVVRTTVALPIPEGRTLGHESVGVPSV